MKRKLLNILMVSSIITTLGFIMDGDRPEPSMLMRFTEFFRMLGILFSLVSLTYFSFAFAFKRIRRS